MANDDLLKYIEESKKSGLNDEDIKKALRDAGWNNLDINEAFNQLSPKPEQVPQEFKNPVFNIQPTLKNSYQSIRQHPQLKYIAGVVLVIIASFVLYKTFRLEKVVISQFELTASVIDAAGINPDSTFILKSTVDIDESVVERYLSVEPKVEIKINKTSTNTFEITPKEKLPENKVFAIKIDAGPIADKTFSWAYQVKASFQVISTLPRDKGADVPLNSGIEVIFNRENMLNPESYIEISPQISGRFEAHRNVIVFVPTQQLQRETVYTVTVKKGIQIQGSNDSLEEEKVFRFETASSNIGYSYFNFDRTFWEFKKEIEPAFEVSYYQIGNVSNLTTKIYRFNNIGEFTDAYKSSIIQDQGWCRFNRSKPYQGFDDKKVFEGKLSVENQYNINFIRLPQKLNEGYYLIDVLVHNKHKQSWFQVTSTPLT